ncbi:MAG: hypothetical protein Q8R28_10955 [Dehalococcoidia bacterium]|nr:hypothetical protein [Dehalococcoidia bacterium]
MATDFIYAVAAKAPWATWVAASYGDIGRHYGPMPVRAVLSHIARNQSGAR